MGFKVEQCTSVRDEDGKLVDMKEEEFTAEDVEHIDEAIGEVVSLSGAIALPGLEWVRNKVAARAGVALRDEGALPE